MGELSEVREIDKEGRGEIWRKREKIERARKERERRGKRDKKGRERVVVGGGDDGAMTKVPSLLSAPDIKGFRENVIIDFTISAVLSRDAPTLGQVRP